LFEEGSDYFSEDGFVNELLLLILDDCNDEGTRIPIVKLV